MVYRFSSLNASENTKCVLYPSAAQTNASEIPVVPAVYSTTVPPGGSRPSAAARSTIARAMRSFMLPVGFVDSSLANMRAEPGGTIRASWTSGVLPIASRRRLCVPPSLMFSFIVSQCPARARPRDRDRLTRRPIGTRSFPCKALAAGRRTIRCKGGLPVRTTTSSVLAFAATMASAAAQAPANEPAAHRLHGDPAAYIAALEDPKRDAYQKPHEVLQALAVKPGEVIADIGAGSGYFTLRLAHQVGRTGR